MSEQNYCMLCNAKECLSTLGHFTLCASCRAALMEAALDFAEKNTVRTTAMHAAFHALSDVLKETPEKFM